MSLRPEELKAAEPAAPKEKAKKQERTTASVRGLVIYADGGARPTNPGFAGAGLHGYIADTGLAVKGVGLGGIVATTKGYFPKTEAVSPEGRDEAWILKKIQAGEAIQTMPESYIERVCVVGLNDTNNAAEMKAALVALQVFEAEQAKTEPGRELKYIQIRSDSQYTCKGMQGWMDRWEKNNWIKPDGSSISNVPVWKEILTTSRRIKDTGVSILIEWVRGHSGETGNERTDKLATLAVFHAMHHKDPEYFHEVRSPADGFWKIDNERHPFIAARHLYFNTLPGATEKGVYYLGNHGKDEDMLGNRMSDGSYAVIRLEETDPVIDTLVEIQTRYASATDSLFSINLTNLFSPEVTYFTNTYGDLGIKPPNGYRLDLEFAGDLPLTRHYNPARISMRAVDALESLDTHLNGFIAGKEDITSTDITSLLYEVTTAKVKGVDTSVYKLRPEINVGLPKLEVDIAHPLSKTAPAYKLALTMGMDVLARNSLKRLEALKPTVHVITWPESEKAFRFATVITAQGCTGIWAGYYSNLRLIA